MVDRKYDMKQVLSLAGLKIKTAAKLLNIHYVTFSKLVKDPSRLTLAQAHLLAEAAGISVENIKI